jgi:hypothetical protein
MTPTQWLPLAAGALAVTALLRLAVKPNSTQKGRWMYPAVLSFAFLAYTLYAAANEGALGFWPEHVRNLWGNQIWFDLLLTTSIAWFLLVPRARVQAMSLLPWLALIFATGSIGFLAALARLLYLEERARARLS